MGRGSAGLRRPRWEEGFGSSLPGNTVPFLPPFVENGEGLSAREKHGRPRLSLENACDLYYCRLCNWRLLAMVWIEVVVVEMKGGGLEVFFKGG